MKNRVDIKNFILQIEKDFPINNWKVNGIHVWPILRYHLFFFLIYSTEKSRLKFKTEKKSKKGDSVFSFWGSIFQWINFTFLIKKKEKLFFSPNHVRVNYKNKSFDRFFDSIIKQQQLQNVSYKFNYHDENENDLKIEDDNYYSLLQYNKGFKNLYKLKNKLLGNKKLASRLEFDDYSLFLEFLNTNPLTKDFATKYSENFIVNYTENILVNALFFETILKKTKPKEIFIICYYTPLMHALLIAAKKRNIKVIEVQHGPMSNTHLSYTNWTNVPQEGYEFLPDEFWCWDEESLLNMTNWTSNTNAHKAFLGGNPWIDFLKNDNEAYHLPNNMVLYTLQPLAFDVLFPTELIELIKKGEWIWYVRLHPRQYNQKQEIITFLQDNAIFEFVNIEEAFNFPLPVLLNTCRIHLTHFSGSAIEASLQNKFTILLDELGVDTFKEIIQNQKALYLPIDHNFSQEFSKIINNSFCNP